MPDSRLYTWLAVLASFVAIALLARATLRRPLAIAATNLPRATLLRRLGALTYDGLLLIAVLMVATALFLPLTGGEAIDPQGTPLLEAAYRLALLALIVGFHGLFWTRRGQTLGMQSWRLRVEREDGRRLGWDDTLRRLAWALVSLAPLGLGYLWILVDPQRRAWHDRLSHTRVVVLPRG
jgi:uncharacterized RDD family membrane protein YckC